MQGAASSSVICCREFEEDEYQCQQMPDYTDGEWMLAVRGDPACGGRLAGGSTESSIRRNLTSGLRKQCSSDVFVSSPIAVPVHPVSHVFVPQAPACQKTTFHLQREIPARVFTTLKQASTATVLASLGGENSQVAILIQLYEYSTLLGGA